MDHLIARNRDAATTGSGIAGNHVAPRRAQRVLQSYLRVDQMGELHDRKEKRQENYEAEQRFETAWPFRRRNTLIIDRNDHRSLVIDPPQHINVD